MERIERERGMLWGLVVGDCLGSPIQFTAKDGHRWITSMEVCPLFNTPAGYWTDDSSMAFCIMESYKRCGGYNLADIGKAFSEWYHHGLWSSLDCAFDVGMATTDGVYGIDHGRLKNGTQEGQGNGSIMRMAPSYILARRLRRPNILHEISDLTHDSARVRETVDEMAAVLDEHMLGERSSRQSIYGTREEVNNSGWCVSTLEAALWAFQSTENFRDGMIAAVNLGGDSDTIGAVYGQIAGAYYGYGEIPQDWITAVKSYNRVEEAIMEFLGRK